MFVIAIYTYMVQFMHFHRSLVLKKICNLENLAEMVNVGLEILQLVIK